MDRGETAGWCHCFQTGSARCQPTFMTCVDTSYGMIWNVPISFNFLAFEIRSYPTQHSLVNSLAWCLPKIGRGSCSTPTDHPKDWGKRPGVLWCWSSMYMVRNKICLPVVFLVFCGVSCVKYSQKRTTKQIAHRVWNQKVLLCWYMLVCI